jgi:hypothetical protein
MERAKNLERRELSDEVSVNTRLQNLSMGSIDLASSNQDGEEQSSSSEESDNELPENMILSFSTGTDDDILQKEYDMLSSSSMNDVTEQGDEKDGGTFKSFSINFPKNRKFPVSSNFRKIISVEEAELSSKISSQ